MEPSSTVGRERWKRSFFATLLVFAVGVVVIGPPLYFAKKVRISLWPVTQCFVVERNDDETFIQFVYDVDGQHYDVTQGYDPYFPLPRDLQEGSMSQCRYNPNDPAQALIHIMGFPTASIMFGLSVIPLLLVVWWLIRRQRERREKREFEAKSAEASNEAT